MRALLSVRRFLCACDLSCRELCFKHATIPLCGSNAGIVLASVGLLQASCGPRHRSGRNSTLECFVCAVMPIVRCFGHQQLLGCHRTARGHRRLTSRGVSATAMERWSNKDGKICCNSVWAPKKEPLRFSAVCPVATARLGLLLTDLQMQGYGTTLVTSTTHLPRLQWCCACTAMEWRQR